MAEEDGSCRGGRMREGAKGLPAARKGGGSIAYEGRGEGGGGREPRCDEKRS